MQFLSARRYMFPPFRHIPTPFFHTIALEWSLNIHETFMVIYGHSCLYELSHELVENMEIVENA